MKLSTSLVAVKKITSTVPRSSFANDELEKSAQLILEAEGVINPIVIRRTSLESYEVVDGDFEYYAAARAKEIDPRKGEMIGAFIIEEGNEEVIKEQVKFLRKQKSVVPANGGSGLGSIEARLTNLESRIETLIKEFKDEQSANRHKLEYELKSVSSQIPNKMEPLEVFNTLSLRELTKRLIAAGLAEQTAIKIAESVESERQEKNFESLSDVVARVKINRGKGQIKGISSDKMVAIVNSWSQVLFI